MEQPLSNLHILVTRPVGLADPLCKSIIDLGGQATHYPVIEIGPPDDNESLQQAVATIDNYDIAIFISPTAIEQTARHITLSKLTLKIAAIGKASAKTLALKNIALDIEPQGNDSESLLEHPLLQEDKIKNKKIIIFKGEGGRNLLADTLAVRSAEVFCANMYRRRQPEHYQTLSSSTLKTIDAVLISSGEGLNNFINMTDDKDVISQLRIFVPGERCAALAEKLGFKCVSKAANATNEAFIDALLEMAGNNVKQQS